MARRRTNHKSSEFLLNFEATELCPTHLTTSGKAYQEKESPYKKRSSEVQGINCLWHFASSSHCVNKRLLLLSTGTLGVSLLVQKVY